MLTSMELRSRPHDCSGVHVNRVPARSGQHVRSSARRQNMVQAALHTAALPFAKHSLMRTSAFSCKSRRNAVKVNAVFEKFTERSIKSVMLANTEAKNLGATEVSSEHLLLGLIVEDSHSKNGYLNSGLSADHIRTAHEIMHGRCPPTHNIENIPFSREVRKIFEAAQNECKRSNALYITPEHILLSILGIPDTMARKVLDSLGVDSEALKGEAFKRVKLAAQEDELPKKKKPESKDTPKCIDEFCRDLCAEARAGRIDPVIGRTTEVSRVMQILARRSKNNPILLGEPGVGKTAIAEGLAYSIVNNMNMDGTPLPAFLQNKRVVQLDVGRLISGAKERGELESRVTKLIAEVKDAGNAILMIDEIHTLIGAGSVSRGGGGGGMDISGLIKPALARGDLQVIGATTIEEFRKYVERDAALERRFQPVNIDEPTTSQTMDILQGLKERYERHHRCVYTEDALLAAVELSHKYVADRFLPDKAIDLMDEAGSRVRIGAYQARRELGKQESPKMREYLQVMDTKVDLAKDGLYEEASILFQRQNDYKAQLSGPSTQGASLPLVTRQDIEDIVAAWTGIPVEQMSSDERARLLNLAVIMKEHVIGQDTAVDRIAAALMRSRCGLKDPNRPIAAMLFVGPTGVGKTELARVLADTYFGSRDSMIRLDMSEYMERHTISKMIGAPPGYVGFGDGGKLTEAIRRRPSSIVLFDEVEKAHPDVFSILLQILEEGRLTDSNGRTVSFKNALVILTSNIGSRTIAGAGRGKLGAFGPGEGDEVSEGHMEHGRLERLVMEEVKTYFKPELLNRFDERVVFGKLGRPEVATIAGLMINDTKARVAAKGFTLEVSKAMMERIIREGYSDEYGVRPLRQLITRYLDDCLAESFLQHKFALGTTILIDEGADGCVIAIDKRHAPAPEQQYPGDGDGEAVSHQPSYVSVSSQHELF